MKNKHIDAFMQTAETFAQCSTAIRLKVGCVIVKDDTIIGIGYNGMPSGWSNDCENYIQHSDDTVSLKTKPEVLHAETNAIAKVSRSTNSSDNSILFVTHAPCLDCAKLIYQSGIKSVYYRNQYRSNDGIEFLNKCEVPTTKI